ncbi:MAG: hypothetical protein RL148_1383 [Planctomycetota bacterium]
MRTHNDIALLELHASHDECLWSQVAFCRAMGSEPLVVCHPAIAARAPLLLPGVETWPVEAEHGTLGRLRQMRSLVRRLQERGVRSVVVNTTSGPQVRDFVLAARSRFHLAGIAHHAGRLHGSATMRLMGIWLRDHFVLAEYVLAAAHAPRGHRVSHFHPVHFPPTLHALAGPRQGFRIVVPGQVESKRRDYAGFFRALAGKDLPPDLEVVLLGRSAHKHGSRVELEQCARECGIAQRIRWFDGFVDDATFYRELQLGSVVMPLVHPGTGNHESYRTEQVSGAFNLGWGFRVPLLVHRSLATLQPFADAALAYDLDSVAGLLAGLARDPEALRCEAERQASHPAFALQTQAARYWSLAAPWAARA